LEEARKNALEMAQEAHETQEARAEDEEALIPLWSLLRGTKGGMG
jgi:hypothetical protein